MNLLKILFNLGVSLGLALTCTIVSLMILSWIVDLFRLNYKGNTYWVLNVCFVIFWICSIISFGYLMSWPQRVSTVLGVESSKPARLNKPYREPLHYVSKEVNGTVESIHIWGRTEVVPVTSIQLTRYFYEDNLWVLEEPQNGGIIQPQGRKGYFMPVMSGTLNSKFGPAQLNEASSVGWADEKNEYWSEFKIANIIFENEEPVAVHYKHYNYDYTNRSWKEIAGYEASFK